jgi:hypothetical protein
MPRISMFKRRSPKISKGELTQIVVIGIAEPMRVSAMKDAPLDGLKEQDGFTRRHKRSST